MVHGNKKYDFEPLKEINGEVVVKPANIYSLKSALRGYFGTGVSIKESFEFIDLPDGEFKVISKGLATI